MIGRPKILWFGRPPGHGDHTEARNRQLEIEVPGENPQFTFARAAVFWATTGHYEQAIEALEAHLAQAMDEGLLIYVVVTEDGQFNDALAALSGLLPKGTPTDRYVLRSGDVPAHEAANAALMHDPGPPANASLEISGAVETLVPEQRLLLQRAFHDCTAIRLEKIGGGFSGATTFLVDATLAASNAGPEPMPYFAKMGDSSKLRGEMVLFRQYAEHHVPWYLRPNFLPDKCLQGVVTGILVGSFVQSSHSLAQVVWEGNGVSHIRSLFEETLGGLRRQSQSVQLETARSAVAALEPFCGHHGVPVVRWEAAGSLFGGEVLAPHTLWRKLLNLPPQRWRRSALHGDMHGENVRIRKGDAIVIDFAQATTGPMSADLANLEIWLSFELSPGPLPERSRWRAVVDALYRSDRIDAELAEAAAAHPLSDCIREIRRLAKLSVESVNEYKRVLAVYLIRQASFQANPCDQNEDEFRRCYAYWLANRLVLDLCAETTPTLEAA